MRHTLCGAAETRVCRGSHAAAERSVATALAKKRFHMYMWFGNCIVA